MRTTSENSTNAHAKNRLEKYSWRDQETVFNNTVPQFRATIALPALGIETPLRIHLIHVRSPRADAVPLLLVPLFPFTNLALSHLIKPLTEPEPVPGSGEDAVSFHLIIPSLPGIGFSDALPNNVSPIAASAALLDTLMTRHLSYPRYLATTAAAGHLSPADIDWRLIRRLAVHHAESCVGAHFISPPLTTPAIHKAPWEWTKWTVANFFRVGILGYSDDDFSALERVRSPSSWLFDAPRPPKRSPGLNELGRLRDPNTLAYALCDSPAGMLVFVLKVLKLLGMKQNSTFFSHERIITLTKLAWLPGPEHALRFWSRCAANRDDCDRGSRAEKPKVAITVFVGETGSGGGGRSGGGSDLESGSAGLDRYACPAWANASYDVTHTQRFHGCSNAQGLLAFERPEVVVDGARGLAKALLAQNPRTFSPSPPEEKGEEEGKSPAVAPLEGVVVVKDDADGGGGGGNAAATTQNKGQELLRPPAKGVAELGGSSETTVTSTQGGGWKRRSESKGKEKETTEAASLLLPPPLMRDPLVDGESPDTLVEGNRTPYLEKAA